MKTRVAVHGRFHAFSMAAGLHTAGCLELLQTTYPEFIARKSLGADLPLDCSPHIEVIRRIGQRLGLNEKVDPWAARSFAQHVAEHISGCQADILVGWSSAILEALEPARNMGVKTVVERGSCHILHQLKMLEDANAQLGLVRPQPVPAEIISRELAEYDAADLITVPSTLAAQSFIDHGIDVDRLFVNPLGVDLGQFQPRRGARSDDRVRIVSVGTVGVRKGSAMLIQACAELGDRVELTLVGPVEPDFGAVLSRLPIDDVVMAGPLSRDSVHQAYAGADIFCLPSVEEGFGMAVLEAMATGLPIVISDQVGAADVVEEGETGFVVPVFDQDALTNALRQLVDDSIQRREMGEKASAAVQKVSNWNDYTDRTITKFRALVADEAT